MDDQAFLNAIDEVRADRRSGAGALARRCLDILAASAEAASATDAAELAALLHRRAAELAAARPSMVAIGCLIARWRSALEATPQVTGGGLADFRKGAAQAARRVLAESEAATDRVAELTSDCLRRQLEGAARPRVLTLSWSSVVAHALAGLAGDGVSVWVAESRPLNEGVKMAEFLAAKGIGVTLVTDAQLAQAAHECDIGLCGADSLFADGTVINKAGTALMALALKDAGRSLAVACESFKMSAGGPAEAAFEEMTTDELGYGSDQPFALRNVYFEAVPPRLIGIWITENGVAESPAAFASLNPPPKRLPTSDVVAPE